MLNPGTSLLLAWWCSARDLPWQWTWRAFPGVWLFVLGLAGAYLGAIAVLARRHAPPTWPQERRRRLLLFTAGVLVLWAAADWPLGLLAAGYLASAHALQYLLITLVAAPLLLLGTPAWLARLPLRWRTVARVAAVVTHPVCAFLLFNAVLVVTQLPGVVDAWKQAQWGCASMNLLWLGSALLMWWPVLGPVPELHRLSYPLAALYLFVQSLLPTIPASFLTFAGYPLYRTYELAPRVWFDYSAVTDQQVAGLTMKLLGGAILWLGIGIAFFKWWASEETANRGEPDALRWEEIERELADLGLTHRRADE